MELNFFLIFVVLSLFIIVKADIPNDYKVTVSNEESSLPKCVTHSLPPNFRENCTKKGGKVTEAHSLAICSDKKTCQCPYYTCTIEKSNERTPINVSYTNKIIPKSSIKSTPNINTNTNTPKKGGVKSTPIINNKKKNTSLPPCITYSLPPNFNEDCTKNGGKVTETYSMALCDDNKSCQCSYFTCATKKVKSKKNKSKVNNATMEATTSTKQVVPTIEDNTQNTCAKKWEQCDGKNFTGSKCCQSGLKCRRINKYYSLCMK